MKVEFEAYWSAVAEEIQPRITLMARIGRNREGARRVSHRPDDRLPQSYWPAARVAVELQARQTAMETYRKLTQNIRAISVIRGCPRKALIHHMLQVRPGALVNNPG